MKFMSGMIAIMNKSWWEIDIVDKLTRSGAMVPASWLYSVKKKKKKKTQGEKILYTKVHGIVSNLHAGQSHIWHFFCNLRAYLIGEDVTATDQSRQLGRPGRTKNGLCSHQGDARATSEIRSEEGVSMMPAHAQSCGL